MKLFASSAGGTARGSPARSFFSASFAGSGVMKKSLVAIDTTAQIGGHTAT